MCLAAASPRCKAKTYIFPAKGLYLADIFTPRPTHLVWNATLLRFPVPVSWRFPPSKHNQVWRAWGRKWNQNQEQLQLWHFLNELSGFLLFLSWSPSPTPAPTGSDCMCICAQSFMNYQLIYPPPTPPLSNISNQETNEVYIRDKIQLFSLLCSTTSYNILNLWCLSWEISTGRRSNANYQSGSHLILITDAFWQIRKL